MGYNSIDFDMSFTKPPADKCAAIKKEIADDAASHKATKCEIVEDGERWNLHIEWNTKDVRPATEYAKKIQDLTGQPIPLIPKQMTH
jgi:hypothetical protein